MVEKKANLSPRLLRSRLVGELLCPGYTARLTFPLLKNR